MRDFTFLPGTSFGSDTFCTVFMYNFFIFLNFGRIFWGSRSCVSYRLLQTVLFLTDSVFRVLFAYFDESMASKIVYKP